METIVGCYPSEPAVTYGLRLVRPSRVLLAHNCWCEDRHSCSALQEVHDIDHVEGRVSQDYSELCHAATVYCELECGGRE